MENNKIMGILSIILGLIFIICPVFSIAFASTALGLSFLLLGVFSLIAGIFGNTGMRALSIIAGILAIIMGFILTTNIFAYHGIFDDYNRHSRPVFRRSSCKSPFSFNDYLGDNDDSHWCFNNQQPYYCSNINWNIINRRRS